MDAACRVYAYNVFAYDVHACTLHAYNVCACNVHAYNIYHTVQPHILLILPAP